MAEIHNITNQERAITPKPIDREAMKALVLSTIKKGGKGQADAIDGLCRMIENSIQERVMESTGQAKPEPLGFAAGKIYTMMPDADRLSITMYLSTRLAHLHAMLGAISGSGFESFRELTSEDIANDYLWACTVTANECKELTDQLF